jgi:hypothetical protein
LNIVADRAPASRPYGRSAVALRASLDPDALTGTPATTQNGPNTNVKDTLDSPSSFRDDQQICNSCGLRTIKSVGVAHELLTAWLGWPVRGTSPAARIKRLSRSIRRW